MLIEVTSDLKGHKRRRREGREGGGQRRKGRRRRKRRRRRTKAQLRNDTETGSRGSPGLGPIFSAISCIKLAKTSRRFRYDDSSPCPPRRCLQCRSKRLLLWDGGQREIGRIERYARNASGPHSQSGHVGESPSWRKVLDPFPS